MEEMFDVYDKEGRWLGVRPKSFCHSKNPGVYHKPVWIWIVNSKNEVLVQKRALTKKHMPGKWDAPSAGHVEAGEDFLSACERETREELGVIVPRSKFVFQKEILSEKVWELGQVYLLVLDIDIKDCILQTEEVAEICWLSFAKFKDLLYSECFVPYDKSYKDWVCEMLQENFRNKQTNVRKVL